MEQMPNAVEKMSPVEKLLSAERAMGKWGEVLASISEAAHEKVEQN